MKAKYVSEELEKQINTLIDLSVANVMDNAITTFRGINNWKIQRRIAEGFVSEIYKKCSMHINLYFDKNKNG